MKPHNNKGLKRLWNACLFSKAGVLAALRTEEAFRTEVALAVVLLPLAFWVNVSGSERLWLVFSVIQLLIIELANTAIERVVDRISSDTHDLSKEAKDMGSAMVLISLLFGIFVWLDILVF